MAQKDGRNGGNTGLPFGLCKKYRIELPDGATPTDAWNALREGVGITPERAYAELKEETPNNSPAETQEESDGDGRASERKPMPTTRAEALERLRETLGMRVTKAARQADEKVLCRVAGRLEELNDRFGAIGSESAKRIEFDFTRDIDFDGYAYVNTDILTSTTGGLYLSASDFGDLDGLEKLAKANAAAGEASFSPEHAADYFVTHEYGHILLNEILRRGGAEKRIEAEEKRATANGVELSDDALIRVCLNVREKMAKEIIDKIAEIDPSVSKQNIRSSGSLVEWFADTFATAQCGKPDANGEALNKYLRNIGFDKA